MNSPTTHHAPYNRHHNATREPHPPARSPERRSRHLRARARTGSYTSLNRTAFRRVLELAITREGPCDTNLEQEVRRRLRRKMFSVEDLHLLFDAPPEWAPIQQAAIDTLTASPAKAAGVLAAHAKSHNQALTWEFRYSGGSIAPAWRARVTLENTDLTSTWSRAYSGRGWARRNAHGEAAIDLLSHLIHVDHPATPQEAWT